MAGFVNPGEKKTMGPVSKLLRALSAFGMRYDDMVLRQSRAIGVNEDRYGWRYDPLNAAGGDYDDHQLFANLSMSDITLRKSISFFDKTYRKKREDLRKFAIQDEIEDILDIVCDESIVVDPQNYFCSPLVFDSDDLKPDHLEKVKASLSSNFKKVYQYFGFNNDTAGWHYFRKWLVDGYLAFEIIYDKEQKNIIGFKELDPITLEPGVDDKGMRVWAQFKGDATKERVLHDSMIIYLSYATMNSVSRISYVERLVRAFNLLRIMEHSRVIWAVVNSSFKTKFIIPVGGKSKTRAAQTLAVLMQRYRENVEFDVNSGELSVNGRPMMPFSKEYWIPESDSGKPEIETFGNDGPDLSDTNALKYFRDKLIKVSKIPMSRFDDTGQALWTIDATATMRDEIRFSKFIKRLRSAFQEILVKPLWLQMCLDYPELKDDATFKSQVGVRFNTENFFDEMAQDEVMSRRVDIVQKMKDALVDTDQNMTEVKFFANRYLAKNYLRLTEDQIQDNEKLKQQEVKKMEKQAAENPPALGGMGGPPGGAPPGGGPPHGGGRF